MEYTVKTWASMQGDVVSLVFVAEAMAKHAASGYGTLPLHGPSLQTLQPELSAVLLDAAVKGQLTVCDQHGRIAPANELIGASGGAETTPLDLLIHLYAKHHHLRRWAETNGDIFHFVDVPGTLVEWDLKNEAGEVIEAGYFRGSVWTGECTVPNAASPAVAQKGATPVSRRQAQETRILEFLADMNHDPFNLPARKPGARGVKANVREMALREPRLFTGSSFEKAWQRLRDERRVIGAE